MSVGLILMGIIAALVLLGVLQRVLDRMGLNDRLALLFAAAVIGCSFIPNIPIGAVRINVGGALIPLALCVYLLIRADTKKEFWRALIGSILTGAAVWGLGIVLPNEPERITLDPNYIWGLAGGVIAYILGRSRRAAFICGVVGVLLADAAVGVSNWAGGLQQTVTLGGAGTMDAVVISGIIAVLLAELVGEIIERMARNKPPEYSEVETPARHEAARVKAKNGGGER